MNALRITDQHADIWSFLSIWGDNRKKKPNTPLAKVFFLPQTYFLLWTIWLLIATNCCGKCKEIYQTPIKTISTAFGLGLHAIRLAFGLRPSFKRGILK